jgi:hypothetical protein
VFATSRREYRQFELAYNQETTERVSSHERKSSYQMSKPSSRRVKQDRMIEVYSTDPVNIATIHLQSQRKAKSTQSQKS